MSIKLHNPRQLAYDSFWILRANLYLFDTPYIPRDVIRHCANYKSIPTADILEMSGWPYCGTTQYFCIQYKHLKYRDKIVTLWNAKSNDLTKNYLPMRVAVKSHALFEEWQCLLSCVRFAGAWDLTNRVSLRSARIICNNNGLYAVTTMQRAYKTIVTTLQNNAIYVEIPPAMQHRKCGVYW